MISLTPQELLQIRRLPARLDSGQTATLLGFQEHDIPILIKKKLLQPLGTPAQNAPKFFGSSEIVKRVDDQKWLGLATQTISKAWREKKFRRLNQTTKA